MGAEPSRALGHLDYDLHYEVVLGSSLRCRAAVTSKQGALLLAQLILFRPTAFVSTWNQYLSSKGTVFGLGQLAVLKAKEF